MSLRSWTLRLLDANGKPLAGAKLELLLPGMPDGAFQRVASADTNAEGMASGKLDPNLGARFDEVPRVLLVDQGALLTFARIHGAGPAFDLDLGTVKLLDPGRREVPDPATAEPRRDRPLLVGVPASEGEAIGGEPGAGQDKVLATIKSLEARVALQDADVSRLKSELVSAKDSLAQREAELADSRARLQAAEEDLGLFRKFADQKVDVGEYASSLGGKLAVAQEKLKDSSFRLSRVAVTTRAFVEDGGAKLQFPNRADRADVAAAPVSDLTLTFQAADGGAVDDGKVAVPDVRQLTESAARRVLGSVGLLLEAIHGPPTLSPGAAEGQAMLQTPATGERVERGVTVTVVFARSAKG